MMLPHSSTFRSFAAAVTFIVAATSPASATWSIVVCDSVTKEVGVASATCLTQIDLLSVLPVVAIGKGGGACQSAGDFDGTRRPIIYSGLVAGTAPSAILSQVAGVAGHQDRQYGIVDTQGRSVTFSGSNNSAWAGGVTGSVGTMYYAIQGNILVGPCVVSAIEAAFRNTNSDMAGRLMAAMQAGRQTGGDGRCSCTTGGPTSCGCPPASFTKSSHIGFMVVARVGDTEDSSCDVNGCADGSYFLKFNVPFQPATNPDPVTQLQSLFNPWRAALVGRPDAITSSAVVDQAMIPPNGVATATMTITLRDFNSNPITHAISTVVVTPAPGTLTHTIIGPAVNRGGGVYTVSLRGGTNTFSLDVFRITVNDGVRPVVLALNPTLRYYRMGDMNCDGVVNLSDMEPFVLALVDPVAFGVAYPTCLAGQADVTRNGTADGDDIQPFANLVVH